MASTERNRGKQANDDKLFGNEKSVALIKEAVRDMAFLLSRGYAEKSAMQLVGNRYRLNVRQQKAVMGMSAGVKQLKNRKATQLTDVNGKTVAIDGFNLIIILESALSGAYLFKGLDGCFRDLSGVHGTYKRVQHTDTALKLVAETLDKLGVEAAIWYLDAPVSNSGRLATSIRQLAESKNCNWRVELVNDPDKVLATTAHVAISADAWILDQASSWFNLSRLIIETENLAAAVVDCEGVVVGGFLGLTNRT
ncbi:DUF434 domain-containing protein [bacterium]|nr:DUF434 domain-containing protein [bacterium]